MHLERLRAGVLTTLSVAATANPNIGAVGNAAEDFDLTISANKACSKTVEGVTSTYGVDVSFPIHHTGRTEIEKNESAWANNRYIGYQDHLYQDFMQGCRTYYGPEAAACDEGEEFRMWKNLFQPSAIMNFTEDGYTKMKVPEDSFLELQEFWRANRPCFTIETKNSTDQDVEMYHHCDAEKERHLYNSLIEEYEDGATNVNYWSVPTMKVEVEDESLVGGGIKLKNKLVTSIQQAVEQWVQGYDTRMTSYYGIRIYQQGSVLAPHVDYDDLIFGVIVNVDQDNEHADWPLEIYGRDGLARNITMSPGEMVLFESQSIIHGRPFPLEGRYYANLFLHFEPISQTPPNESDQNSINGDERVLPFYVNEESEYGEWIISDEEDDESGDDDSFNPFVYEDDEACYAGCYGPLPPVEDAWRASYMGDLPVLRALVEYDSRLLSEMDNGGWQCLHFAASEGLVDIVDFILKNNVDINALFDIDDPSSTPLGLAKSLWGYQHPVAELLESQGALQQAYRE